MGRVGEGRGGGHTIFSRPIVRVIGDGLVDTDGVGVASREGRGKREGLKDVHSNGEPDGVHGEGGRNRGVGKTCILKGGRGARALGR